VGGLDVFPRVQVSIFKCESDLLHVEHILVRRITYLFFLDIVLLPSLTPKLRTYDRRMRFSIDTQFCHLTR
jgi:hypothetical protein